MTTITIDPGASGGIAWQDTEVHAIAMPETNGDLVAFLRQFCNKPCLVVVEKTGTWAPKGQGAASLLRFARHCGAVEGILQALELPTVEVLPRTWQQKLGAFSPDKPERKRQIKALVQQRYPNVKVTLATADALGILASGAGIPSVQAPPAG